MEADRVAPAPDAERTAADPPSASREQTAVAGAPTVRRSSAVATLTVGAADDPYEREADRAADEVLRRLSQPQPDPTMAPAPPPRLSSEPMQAARSALRRATAPSVIGADGGQLDAPTDAAIGRARGAGKPIEEAVRRSMESGFGADFTGVRVHTDATAHQLNEQLSARAFTTGSDIFFGRGEYNPGDTAGQRLLAHELSHTIQQGGASVRRSPLDTSAAAKIQEVGGPARIQREWRPASTKKNAHLRNDGQWDDYVGSRIDDGTEVVVDRAAVKTEVKKRVILGEKQTGWMKAVDETAEDFDPAVHGNATTYIRASSVGPDKDYGAKGLPVDKAQHQPPARKAIGDLTAKWLPALGEYVEIEESVTTPGAHIVHYDNTYKRLQGGQLHDLDATEQLQLNTDGTRTFFRDKVISILQQENAGTPWELLLATQANAEKIIAGVDAAKALRIDSFKSSYGEMYVSWFRWALAVDGPLSRIRRGAKEVNDSLTHWRSTMYPDDPSQVAVTKVSLTGSDLHEFCLLYTSPSPRGGHQARSPRVGAGAVRQSAGQPRQRDQHDRGPRR